MNLQALKIFYTVMTTGSYSAAAQKHNCSQPTVTFQIHQLEEYLGIQLFEKIGRHNYPTDQARTLLPKVIGLLDNLAQIDKFKEVRRDLKGEIYIGICDGVFSYRLPHLFKRFNFLAPNVNIITHCDTAASLISQINKGELDLALTFNRGNYPASASTYPLKVMKLSLIVNSQTKIGKNAFMFPNQRIDHPFIVSNLNSGPAKFFLKFLKELCIETKGMIQLNNVESVKHFILSDFGFTYTLEHNFDSEIKSGALKVLPTALGQASIGLILMKNRNKVESPSVSLLSQLIIEELSNPKEEFKDFYTKTLLKYQLPLRKNRS